MKRKAIIAACVSAVAVVFVAVWLIASCPAERVSLSFVEYTNDQHGFRTNRYLVPDIGDHSMAVFCVVNHGTRTFSHYGGFTELRAPSGWVYDTNQLPIPRSAAAVLEPGQVTLVTVPTPPDTESWRCSLRLTRLTQLPNWRWQLARILGRGIDFEKEEFTISSQEIQR